MTHDDGTGPSPMWTDKDQAIGWVMCGIFTLILTIGWAAFMMALWSHK